MTPTYIMPTRPTCKVVKREGERGARIDPKELAAATCRCLNNALKHSLLAATRRRPRRLRGWQPPWSGLLPQAPSKLPAQCRRSIVPAPATLSLDSRRSVPTRSRRTRAEEFLLESTCGQKFGGATSRKALVGRVAYGMTLACCGHGFDPRGCRRSSSDRGLPRSQAHEWPI